MRLILYNNFSKLLQHGVDTAILPFNPKKYSRLISDLWRKSDCDLIKEEKKKGRVCDKNSGTSVFWSRGWSVNLAPSHTKRRANQVSKKLDLDKDFQKCRSGSGRGKTRSF